MTNYLLDVSNEVVGRAVEGDAQAVADIVRALERPIFNVALRMLREREDAEDAAQEALIRIVTRLGQFRGESRFSTWAWRIAVHRILDVQEQEVGASETFARFAADLADGTFADAKERAEDAIHCRQLKIVCSRAMLQCLDPDQRIAFVLGEIVGLPSNEAAEILEIEAATFRKRLSRARAALTTFLRRNCGVFDGSAPCACHRRLGRARDLGRLNPSHLEATEGDLVALRAHLSTLGHAERLAAYYQRDPLVAGRREFVETVRAMIGDLRAPRARS